MLRTNDGQPIDATKPKDVVRHLHKMSMTPCRDDNEFMRQTAGRVRTHLDKRVRCNSASNFVKDLKSAGLLVDEDEDMIHQDGGEKQ
jgi:hypothetical protein